MAASKIEHLAVLVLFQAYHRKREHFVLGKFPESDFDRLVDELAQCKMMLAEALPDVIAFMTPDRRRGFVIHRSSKHAGRWQATRFVHDGFTGDSDYKTKADALFENLHDEWPVQDYEFERLAKTPIFIRGCEKTRIVQMINARLRMGDLEAHTTLLEAFETSGLAAARKLFQEMEARDGTQKKA